MTPPVTISIYLTPDAGSSDEPELLSALCEIVTQDNVRWMQRAASRGHVVPECAADAGIRYRPPTMSQHRRGHVEIHGAQSMIDQGWGACGGLACFDAAALRFRGQDASPRIVAGPWGPGSYHAIVETAAGHFDPAQLLTEGNRACFGQ